MIKKRIEEIASQILNNLNINELPVPISLIAESIGLKIYSYDLGENISGALVIDKGQGIIGINPLESSVRQRFTIAHELGHFVLHRNVESLFVDKDFKVLFRNQESSTGELKREQDANAFAAAILMPKKLLAEKINDLAVDLTDEYSVKHLAQMFDVSVTAMTYRIINLNLIQS